MNGQRVWKFPFPVQDEFELEIPSGARLLHVAAQADPESGYGAQPCIWALVDPEKPKVRRRFRCAGTGHAVERDDPYLGTFMLLGGQFVGHVFEVLS